MKLHDSQDSQDYLIMFVQDVFIVLTPTFLAVMGVLWFFLNE